jgi:serine/threonine protein kinase
MIRNNISNKKNRVIGDESYGCIITPAVKCDENIVDFGEIDVRDSVMKIYKTNKKETKILLDKNIKYGKFITSIDPYQKYFVIPIKYCKSSRKSLLKNSAFKNCKVNKKQEQFTTSIMENQEYDLYEYILSYKQKTSFLFPKKTFILMIRNLLDGLKLLIDNRLVHQDIKANNITFRIKPSSINIDRVFKLIDFDLIEETDTVYTSDNERLNTITHYYPIEYVLANNYLNNITDKNKEKFKTRLITEIYEHIYDIGLIGLSSYQNLINPNDLDKKIKIQVNKYVRSPDKYFNDSILNNTGKIDIYSLGMMCIYVEHLLSNDNMKKTSLNKYEKFLKGLVEIDPNKRYDINKAISEYNNLIKSM